MGEMKFVDKEHEKFWNKKYNEMKLLGKTDVYYKSLVYVLGVCETTRENFNKIFDLKNGEINIDSIQGAYQTGTSAKVTRMAFSLWNRCMYDSSEERERGEKSSAYNPSEIFCCSYAPFFYEAIKIRYPEYTREQQASNQLSAGMYMRVGNIEQLDHYIKEDIVDIKECVAGLYIRTNEETDDEKREHINKQQEKLEKYCKDNEIINTVKYIDIGESSNNSERKALNRLIGDMDKGLINKVIIPSASSLFRDITKLIDFVSYANFKNIEVVSLDDGLLNKQIYPWIIDRVAKELGNPELLEDEETEDMEY